MTDSDPGAAVDRDVVIVGGGPAGCAAGVFTARYGLNTLVFDRGPAALARAAYIANYPGFPAGIDVETFRALLRDHAAEAGCDRIAETVERVERLAAGEHGDGTEQPGFVVSTDADRAVTARSVIGAAWYDGSYLRPVVGDDAFELHEHHGETEERFDHEYADPDGRTPVDGLYVAAPRDGRNAQAIVSAGQGAHVARQLLADRRMAEGYPEGVLAAHYDWLRPETEFGGEWGTRDRWREWFDNERPDDHDPDGVDPAELRERYIDAAFGTKLSDADIEGRRAAGQRQLLEHLDDDLVLERAREIEAEEADPGGSETPTELGR